MRLDVGRIYKILTTESSTELRELQGTRLQYDKDRTLFGFLPLMASCTDGQLGALNAESFAERIISGGNLTVDDGNTKLNHGDVEKLTVLRMNGDFMFFMRKNYADAIKSSQPWNMTVVNP